MSTSPGVIEINDELWEKLAQKARKDGCSESGIVEDALLRFFASEPTTSVQTYHMKGLLLVPAAGTTSIVTPGE